jgi:hypothetical protein
MTLLTITPITVTTKVSKEIRRSCTGGTAGRDDDSVTSAATAVRVADIL